MPTKWNEPVHKNQHDLHSKYLKMNQYPYSYNSYPYTRFTNSLTVWTTLKENVSYYFKTDIELIFVYQPNPDQPGWPTLKNKILFSDNVYMIINKSHHMQYNAPISIWFNLAYLWFRESLWITIFAGSYIFLLCKLLTFVRPMIVWATR